MDFEHLRSLRLQELDGVRSILGETGGKSILDVGAGAGWQARELSKLGLRVGAVDLTRDRSGYSSVRVWPVIPYDGTRIPFADQSFDYVFSSNVLEHIPHLETFQAEIQRLLKPGGVAIHVLPTATWRLWTSVAHYVSPIKELLRHLRRSKGEVGDAGEETSVTRALRRNTTVTLLRRLFVPARHGVAGTWLTEAYYFSRFRWAALFRRSGWEVERHFSNRLFFFH